MCDLIDRSADGDHAEVKRLLERGDADTEAKTSESGFTALHWAAWNGHTEVIRLLVEHRANLEARNIDGYTPLMRAAINGRLDAITLLLTLGASTTATNDFSETALACAQGPTDEQEDAAVLRAWKPPAAGVALPAVHVAKAARYDFHTQSSCRRSESTGSKA